MAVMMYVCTSTVRECKPDLGKEERPRDPGLHTCRSTAGVCTEQGPRSVGRCQLGGSTVTQCGVAEGLVLGASPQLHSVLQCPREKRGDGHECDGTGPGAGRTRAARRKGLAALTMGAAAFSQHGAVYSESRYAQGLLSLLFQKKLVRMVFGRLGAFLKSPGL